tara:strand:+ start:502 stop:708 length:207 start_codon:yes stop_codon:yes gene_type:complete
MFITRKLYAEEFKITSLSSDVHAVVAVNRKGDKAIDSPASNERTIGGEFRKTVGIRYSSSSDAEQLFG